MKKGLKVLLIIILILVLGLEIYYYLNQNKTATINEKLIETPKKIDTKNLVNLYTGYNYDNLTFKIEKEEKNVIYQTINGLKDKDIENKVNAKIKEKIKNLKQQLNSKEKLYNKIVSNFENTISIAFFKNDYEDPYDNSKDLNEHYLIDSEYLAVLNIDLTTGNELTIMDIINKKESLKSALVKLGYDDLYKEIGIVCEGGPCTNPEPNYSTVEDSLLSIVNQFNKNNYKFTYTPEALTLIFDDVKINNPIVCDGEEADKNCKKYENVSINQTNYETRYGIVIPMYELADNLLIYDKFKTENNIYEKNSTLVERKFILPDSIESVSKIIENKNSLIDYNIPGIIFENKNFYEKIRNIAVKEVSGIKTNKFNIYNMMGKESSVGDYYYVWFDVRHYSLDKSIYEQYKKRIYLDKLTLKEDEMGNYVYNTYTDNGKKELGYEYLKKYLNKKAYLYYLLDDNGKEVYEKDILSKEYLKSVIPSEWLRLGKYHTYDELINNSLILKSEDYSYPNNLVIYIDDDSTIKLKYKGKVINLTKNSEVEIEEKLFK